MYCKKFYLSICVLLVSSIVLLEPATASKPNSCSQPEDNELICATYLQRRDYPEGSRNPKKPKANEHFHGSPDHFSQGVLYPTSITLTKSSLESLQKNTCIEQEAWKLCHRGGCHKDDGCDWMKFTYGTGEMDL